MAKPEIAGRLTMDDSRFHAGIRRSLAAANSFSRSLGASMRRVASGPIGLLGTAISAAMGGAALKEGVKTIADFGSAMSKVGALSGATAGDMKRMSDMARQMGAATQFSATEAGEGMAFLAQAGFKVNQILAASQPLLELAIAGGLDLAEAMDIASNIMTPFGMKAEEAARVSDVLAKVAAASNTNVSQLGEAFKQAAPMASMLKIRFDEVSAAIGALGNAGIQGESAGTALRNIMARLVKPTTEVEQSLKSIGLTTDEVNPATHSLIEIFEKLSAAQEKTGDTGRNAAANVGVFGLRAQAAGAVLISTVGAFKDLTREANNSKGAAKEMSAVMADNLKGDFKAFQSALQELALAIGEGGLTSFLRDATKAATEFFREFSAEKGEGIGQKLKAAGETFLGMFADPGLALEAFGYQLYAEIAAVMVKSRDGLLKLGTLFRDGIFSGGDPARWKAFQDLISSAMRIAGNVLKDACVEAVGLMYDGLLGVAAIFSSKIVKALEDAIEAVAAIPGIGKALGIDGYTARSDEEIFNGEKERMTNTGFSTWLSNERAELSEDSKKVLKAVSEYTGILADAVIEGVGSAAKGVAKGDFGKAASLNRVAEIRAQLRQKGQAMLAPASASNGAASAFPDPNAKVAKEEDPFRMKWKSEPGLKWRSQPGLNWRSQLSDTFKNFSSFKGESGLQSGGLSSGGLSSGGLVSGAGGGQGYNVIRRGDAARRKAEAAAGKEKVGVDKTNEILAKQLTTLNEMKEAWNN